MCRVIVDFFDIQDAFYAYHAGDVFPREGVKASEERIAYLAGSGNRLGVPVIEEVREKRSKKAKT